MSRHRFFFVGVSGSALSCPQSGVPQGDADYVPTHVYGVNVSLCYVLEGVIVIMLLPEVYAVIHGALRCFMGVIS